MISNGEGFSVRPLLSLCMIVKDEEENLPRCLESVLGVVDEMVVVDTGSTDATKDIALSFGARVIDFPWTGDFSAARNAGLEQAAGQWILVLDADEELVEEDRPLVRAFLRSSDKDGYFVRCLNYLGDAEDDNEVLVHGQFRLFRNRPKHRFRGPIHEQMLGVVQEAGGQIDFSRIRIRHYGYTRRAALERDKIERNVEIIRRALAEKPDDSFMLFNLGMEYLRLGEFEQALAYFVRSFRSLRRLDVGYADMLVRNICVSLLYLGRHDECLKVAREAQAGFPGFTDLVYIEGVALLRQNRFSEARAAFERCLELGPSDPWYASELGVGCHKAWAGLGQAHEHLGEEGKAAQAYLQAVRENPNFVAAAARLAVLLLRREDPADVAAFFRRHLKASPRRVWEHLAHVFCQEGAAAEALELLDHAESVMSWLPGRAGEPGGRGDSTRLVRAECLFLMGRTAEARSLAEQVSEDALTPHAVLLRALASLSEGNRQNAARLAEEAAAREETREQGAVLAEFLRALAGGEPTAATPGAEEEAGFAEGAIMWLLRSLLRARAFELFERALPLLDRVPGRRAEKKLLLGRLYYWEGFRDSAFDELADALEEGVYDHDGLVILAQLCEERGLAEDAVNLYAECLRLNPERVATYTSLARLLAGQGRHEEARGVLEMGLARYPDSELLQAAQEALLVAAGR